MRTYSGRSIVDSGRRRILEPSDTTVIFCLDPRVFKRYSSDFFDESKCTRFNFLAYISGSTDTKPIWICFFTSPRYNRSSIPWMYLDGLLRRSVSIRPCTNWCSACEPIPLEHSASNTATPPFFTSKRMDHLDCIPWRGWLQIQIGLVSVLPEMYAKKLNLVHLDSSKKSLEYLLKTRGSRQKITVVSDGSRILLRPESTILRPE